MAWRHPPGHAQVKKLIASCAASGVGIEYLEAAPRFRFTPVPQSERSPEHGPPSKRGSIACGKPKPKHIRNWTPSRLDLDPMYAQPMTGDSHDLTYARKCYAMGNPEPLREWLAGLSEWNRAQARRLSRQQQGIRSEAA